MSTIGSARALQQATAMLMHETRETRGELRALTQEISNRGQELAKEVRFEAAERQHEAGLLGGVTDIASAAHKVVPGRTTTPAPIPPDAAVPAPAAGEPRKEVRMGMGAILGELSHLAVDAAKAAAEQARHSASVASLAKSGAVRHDDFDRASSAHLAHLRSLLRG